MERRDSIDTDLYSRQIGTFGFEMMGRLQRQKVLIVGLKGSGVEIGEFRYFSKLLAAKNLALMGVDSIGIKDDDVVAGADLGSNFYLNQSHVGTSTVAAACLESLKDLNRNLTFQHISGALSEEVVTRFDVVVACDQDFETIKALNYTCRNNALKKRIGFILADTFGMIGAVFVDFGDDFYCWDPSGGEIKHALVTGVSQDEKATVFLHNDAAMPFQTGDYVKFREVGGMVELNSLDPVPIVVKDSHSFQIGDTRAFGTYTSGGIVTEVRRGKVIPFRSFESCIKHPSDQSCLMTMDYSLIGRAEQLHWITMAHRMDPVNFLKVANELVASAESCKVDSVDVAVAETFLKYHKLKISPICSFIGGIVAHEVVKFTGKYHPIQQWLYCDLTLPRELLASGLDKVEGVDARYSQQVQIWGHEVQQKLQDAKTFVVGSGALGCEFLKHFALMGCGTGPQGKVYVTDNDRIETSNITRQFLFKRRHVGQPKSKVAAEAAKEINPAINIEAFEVRVGEDTEDFFNEAFWSQLTLVVNALDNIKARQYVDGQCVWYEKPLLESGTLGTMGNVQVVIPYTTQCYSESQDPPETSIPLCTLKHFPYQIEHCIEWARDIFQGTFSQIAYDFKRIKQSLAASPVAASATTASATSCFLDSLHEIPLERLELLLKLLKVNPATLDKDLIKIALELANSLFVNAIHQLLYSFPPHHTSGDGQLFWSPPKRMPSVLPIDFKNEHLLRFVIAACKLFCDVLQVQASVDEAKVLALAPSVVLPEFKPKILKLSKDNVNVEIEAPVGLDAAHSNVIDEIRRSVGQRGLELLPVEFEKDDDTNMHIDFIWAAASLRALNYSIEGCDRLKAKLISGKIIPAIATTTAMVGGLVALEYIKAVCYKQLKIDHFRNAFACLATPVWLQSEPLPPSVTKDSEYDPIVQGPTRAVPPNFTVWNKLLVFIPNGTVKQLLDWIKSQLNVQVVLLSAQNTCLYNSFIPTHAQRLGRCIAELYETLARRKLGPNDTNIALEASCIDDDEVDVIVPTIKFCFKR